MTDEVTAYFLVLVVIYYLARAAIWIFSSRPIAHDPYDQLACCRFRGQSVKLIPPSFRTRPG